MAVETQTVTLEALLSDLEKRLEEAARLASSLADIAKRGYEELMGYKMLSEKMGMTEDAQEYMREASKYYGYYTLLLYVKTALIALKQHIENTVKV